MFPVLAVEISRSWLMCAGLGVVAAVALIAFTRTRAEHHKKAQKAAGVLREYHLPLLAAVLDCYAIDDFRGGVTALKELIATLKDRDKLQLSFWNFAAYLIETKLRNPETRDAAIKWLDNLKVTTTPGGPPSANLESSVRELVATLKDQPRFDPLPVDPKPAAAPPKGS